LKLSNVDFKDEFSSVPSLTSVILLQERICWRKS